MDELDSAIEQTLKTADKARMSATAADPLGDAVDQVVSIDKVRRQASLRSAVQVNPDEAAQANKLAASRGLPPDVVLRNLQQVKQDDAAERANKIMGLSPALATKMRDLPFAQVAHDSVESLGAIESHIRVTGEIRAARGPDPTLGSYLTGVWESVKGRAKQADIGISLQIGDLAEKLGFAPDPVRRGELIRRYQQAGSNVDMSTPEFKSDTAKGIYGGVSSTASMVAPTALSILMRNPTPAMAAMGVQVEAEAYGKYRSRGATPGEALVGGVAEGAVEVLTEKIPMGFIVQKFGKGGAKEFLAGMLMREVPSEQVATFLQDAIDTAIANPDKTWGEFWKERPSAAYQTLMATLTQASIMGGASATVQKIAQRAERKQLQTEQDTNALQGLLDLAGKDKLRERDPNAFASMVQAAAEQHGMPGEVYIDAGKLAETLAQSGMKPEQIEAALPSARAQLMEAVAAGGDVVVPIGEFTSLVAGSGFEQQLVKHARLSPDALSQEDAKLLAKVDLKAETEKVMAQQAQVAEGQAVKAQVLEQLNTAGRFSPAVNEAYADSVAALYETQAARLGIPVAEFAKRYPLNVTGVLGSAAKLDQPAYHGTHVRGIEQFTTQKMGTGEGAQAFGWGMYFAKAKQIAEFYRESITRMHRADNPEFAAARHTLANELGAVDFLGFDRWQDAYAALKQDGYDTDGLTPEQLQRIRAAIAEYDRTNKDTSTGQLYEVDVPEDSDLLDYDAPLKEQPEKVRKALESLGFKAEVYAAIAPDGKTIATDEDAGRLRRMVKANNHDVKTIKSVPNPITGKQIYYELEQRRDLPGVPGSADMAADEAASRALFAAGIPGLRFLDAGSRGAQAQGKTHNYVIFDDSAVQKTGEFYQEQGDSKGTFTPNTNTIALLAKADLSTFHHELGHFYLEVLADMAAQPDAPAAVVEDMNKVLEWFGVPDLAAWRAMSLDQQREFHEKFARGYEAYLFEGKAPSTALSRTFQRFSEWMRRIYRSIKALNVELNDDIRRVYDRMLASEEAIKEAETARAYAPLFKDEKALEEAGVDPASYHALGSEATAEAIDRLQERSIRDMRWLSNAKGRALKALQKEAAATRKGVEAQVREEVNARPEYRAADLIAEADKTFAADPTAADPGLQRAAIADALGFSSIDSMARAIEEAPPRAEIIEGMTDQRMLEEHGELSSPDALERAAEQAIHNEARGKFIATELAALDKALGPARVLVAAAKQFATAVLGRKQITDIKPHVFTAAETRAAKLAEKSLGKVEEAATAKRNQLLNHYAARYAHDAVAEIARIREFFARVANTPDDRLKSRDMDVVNAARAVLAAYGVGRRGEAAADYLKKVAAYDPDMSQVLQASVDAALANAKPLAELTLDELRALNDEVASLWHLAKRSRQMEIDGDLLDREEVQDQLKARIDDIGVPLRIPGEGSAVTPAEARLAKLKTYLASARRTEGWVEAMDGKPSGVFRSFIWQPVKEAADAYRTDKARLLKQYRALLDAIAPTFRKRIVDAPELGYTFGKDTGGVALNEILHALLHTGNASNKKKLLLGRKWATENIDGTLDTSRWDAFVQRMVDEGVLTKAHFDFVQGVWDLLEETKPLAQKTHRDVFGKYFAEITAEPVATPFGEYRGGYVPAQADPRVVSDAKTRTLMEEENASMAFAFPSTNRGFTKGRVEYNRPLTLDLGTLAQHIDRVLLFAHMERPIRDVRRVLTSKGVAYGVNRIDPAAFDAIISPWLNRAARQQVTTPSPGHWQSWRLWSTLRNRAGMAAMFGNVVNAAQQITGFSIAAVKVKPKYLLGAMGHYVTNPRQMAQDVAEASPYMEGRMRNEVAAMNDAIKDILIDPSLYERGQQWTMRHAYFMQSAVDNVMSPIIWTAARNQALEQGQSEKEATRFADATVRQTQGSTLPEDISNWEAGSSFSRMFSQFAGYFNMQANLLGTEFQTIARDMGVRKGAGRGLYVTLMAFLIPAWTSELIVQAFRGGPEDEDKDGEYLDDWLAAVFGMATLRGVTAMVPIFGQGMNAIPNALNDKPYDDRLATSPAISMIEAAVKSPVSVYKALFEDGDKSKAVKDVASLISLTTGIPANIAARPASYMLDVAEGDVQPTGPVDAARGAVTGRASPDSKR